MKRLIWKPQAEQSVNTIGGHPLLVQHIVCKQQLDMHSTISSPSTLSWPNLENWSRIFATVQKPEGSYSSEKRSFSSIAQTAATLWNSAFVLVDHLIEVKLTVTTILQNDDNYKHRNLSDREGSLAKELRDVLGTFEKVTTVMGGQNYVTMS